MLVSVRISKTLGNPLRGHLGSSCAADPKSELLQVGEARKTLNLGLARGEKKNPFCVGTGGSACGVGWLAWGWGYGHGDGFMGMGTGCWVWK